MPDHFVFIHHAQVQWLKPGDVIRFMDPDPLPYIAVHTGGWLKVVSVADEPGKPNIRSLVVDNGYDKITCTRREWAAVQVLGSDGGKHFPISDKEKVKPAVAFI